jgi:enoyl-CoA hydratase
MGKRKRSEIIMDAYETLLFERKERIGIITFNRPEALNALNLRGFLELSRILDEVAEDKHIRVIMLTGQGKKAFIAGTDVMEMQHLTPTQARDFALLAKNAIDKIESLEKPVIAAVNGFALGGGCEVTLACDLRIASENARFGQPEITLGIIPGSGGTQRLQRLIGIPRAKQLIFTGEVIDAKTALQIGLVNHVVPLASLMIEAENMANKMVDLGGVALGLAKAAINWGSRVGLGEALHYEIECFSQCFATRDQKEGMTAFLEKRKPQFLKN